VRRGPLRADGAGLYQLIKGFLLVPEWSADGQNQLILTPLDECRESRFAGYLVNALRVGFLVTWV
jgi:hypothetical protein